MDEADPLALIESAMSGVRVILCPMCNGEGRLRDALDLLCPRCRGAGKTTTSGMPLSKWDEEHDR